MKISSKKRAKDVSLSRRDFLKGTAALPLLTLAATGSASAAESKLTAAISKKAAKILIVGAGSGGMDAAARLRRAAPNAKITIVAPNDVHLYQSGQVFVAAGIYTQADNRRNTTDLLPDGVRWLQDSVTRFDPENNRVETSKNGTIGYDLLVVATGVRHDFSWAEGVSRETIGKGAVASVYLNDVAKGEAQGGEQTRQWFDSIATAAQNGETQLLFALPEGDIQAENAGLDVLLLGLDVLRGKGPGVGPNVADKLRITLVAGNERLIASKTFDTAVRKVLAKVKNLTVLTQTTLQSIDPEKKTAQLSSGGTTKSLSWDFLHIVPKIRPADAVASSPLALSEGARKGFVDVDPVTLQHKRYKNVFALGDVAALSAKSGAATRDMAIVIQDNVANALEGRPLDTRYTGYTAAPLRTRFGREMLIEYDRKGPNPTFPLDPTVPRWIWWELDVHLLRWAYFDLMMRGLM